MVRGIQLYFGTKEIPFDISAEIEILNSQFLEGPVHTFDILGNENWHVEVGCNGNSRYGNIIPFPVWPDDHGIMGALPIIFCYFTGNLFVRSLE